MPGPVADRAVRAAAKNSLRVILDPGGWASSVRYVTGFAQDVFLIKPNALEAERLTGVRVGDFTAARTAAELLIQQGVQNVLITDGANGAYLFGDGLDEHIEAPVVRSTGHLDSTGCGDQVMAALCALLCNGWDLADAASFAVRAGTLQFHRTGVRPLSLDEIMVAKPDSDDHM
jgi:ribokinase